jgi:hypothetical protein
MILWLQTSTETSEARLRPSRYIGSAGNQYTWDSMRHLEPEAPLASLCFWLAGARELAAHLPPPTLLATLHRPPSPSVLSCSRHSVISLRRMSLRSTNNPRSWGVHSDRGKLLTHLPRSYPPSRPHGPAAPSAPSPQPGPAGWLPKAARSSIAGGSCTSKIRGPV